MKENKIDKLFNSKLKDLEKEPSAAAWETIENKLNNKKRFFYLRIAASLLLISLSVVVASRYFQAKQNAVDNKLVAEEVIPEIKQDIQKIVPPLEEDKGVIEKFIERKTKELEREELAATEQIKKPEPLESSDGQQNELESLAAVTDNLQEERKMDEKDRMISDQPALNNDLVAQAEEPEPMTIKITYRSGSSVSNMPDEKAEENSNRIDKIVSDAEGLIYEGKHALKKLKTASEDVFAFNIGKNKKDKKKKLN